jgi:arsenite methyltransferase
MHRAVAMWCPGPMNTLGSRALDAAFGHPRGLLGRLGGAIMARGNAEQERWAVDHAGLRRGRDALVVGHGPGVGVAMAAAAVTPGGHVVAVDPSPTMHEMAAARCSAEIEAGVVELRAGTAEDTGCADSSVDSVVSVNNVMLWDRPAGFRELHRVLRPGGRLIITVHRHVLGVDAEQLRAEAADAGFENIELSVRPRRANSPAIELLGQVRR